MAELILVINPGSTSTKVAVYDGETELNRQNIDHSAEELKPFKEINDQLEFRKQAVLSYLREQKVQLSDLAAHCGQRRRCRTAGERSISHQRQLCRRFEKFSDSASGKSFTGHRL